MVRPLIATDSTAGLLLGINTDFKNVTPCGRAVVRFCYVLSVGHR